MSQYGAGKHQGNRSGKDGIEKETGLLTIRQRLPPNPPIKLCSSTVATTGKVEKTEDRSPLSNGLTVCRFTTLAEMPRLPSSRPASSEMGRVIPVFRRQTSVPSFMTIPFPISNSGISVCTTGSPFLPKRRYTGESCFKMAFTASLTSIASPGHITFIPGSARRRQCLRKHGG